MKYVSTRGGAAPVDFRTAALKGLAPDGGLYVPDTYPRPAAPLHGQSYGQFAGAFLASFAEGSVDRDDMIAMAERAYNRFSHPLVAPLVQYAQRGFVLELFHGPTLAYKDVAMQLFGELYDHLLKQTDERMTVVCATSGDTGGAAAAAFAGRGNVRLVILHPHERVSPVQRLFMTTTGAENVLNIAIDGDFDDAQAMVKTMFADTGFADEISLSGVNSINWVRIAAQAVYYAWAQAAFGADAKLRFVVPSGNFGDAFAGYVAARCGLLNGFDLVAAVNANDTLEQTFGTGVIERRSAHATLSPAMDIALPSNLERLLFEASGRDPDAVRAIYDGLKQSGRVELSERIRGALGCVGIRALSVTDEATQDAMRGYAASYPPAPCPHTAVGMIGAERAGDGDGPHVVLATAHAAKFPETVMAVTGKDAPLPTRCEALRERGEVFERLPADYEAVKARVRAFASR